MMGMRPVRLAFSNVYKKRHFCPFKKSLSVKIGLDWQREASEIAIIIKPSIFQLNVLINSKLVVL